jgi:hypothetical protein
MTKEKDTATMPQEESLEIERDVTSAVRLLERTIEHVGHRGITITHTVKHVHGQLEEMRTMTIEVKE